MKVFKNGICCNIQQSDLKRYLQAGWKSVGCPEPQPQQDDLYVIDDYTIGRLDNKEFAK